MLEGELVLHEDDGETVLKPGDAAGWRANGGIGHCLINRTDRTRSISKSAPDRRTSACTIPTSISAWSATSRAAAGCARTANRSRSEGDRWPIVNFKLDVDADGIAHHHLGHARQVDERHRSVGDRGTWQDRREDRSRRRDQGRGHHLRQGHVLRRRRPDAARIARPACSPRWRSARARRPRRRCCSTKAASCRSSTGASRPAASRSSPRSTAPRSAAASSSASPAISASPPTTTRPASACPR